MAVRLIDCWAPEMREEGGPASKDFLTSLLEEYDEPLRLWLPPLKDTDRDGILDIKEILSQMTFDRVPGRLFLGTQDVSEIMVRHGHAARTRGPNKED